MHDPGGTIVAQASAAGPAARVVVRLSGASSHTAVQAVFAAGDGAPLSGRRMPGCVTGTVFPAGVALPAMVLLSAGPRSFTGEDTAELHLPGSAPLAAKVIEALCRAGPDVRPAMAGEFTRRALLAGKMSLRAAEALPAVIASRNRAELLAARRATGATAAKVAAVVRAGLTDLLAEWEAGIDFVDEDITFLPAGELRTRLAAMRADLLAATGTAGPSGTDPIGDDAAAGHPFPETCPLATPQAGVGLGPPGDASGGSGRLLADSASPAREARSPVSAKAGSEVAGTGAVVVLIGAPNAGKSSLFNVLVGEGRAIVSPEAGTTRDTVEAVVTRGGRRVRLLDTAGLTDDAAARGELDRRAQGLSREGAAGADLILHVVDGTLPGRCEANPECGADAEDGVPVEARRHGRVIEVRSKADLRPSHGGSPHLRAAASTSPKRERGRMTSASASPHPTARTGNESVPDQPDGSPAPATPVASREVRCVPPSSGGAAEPAPVWHVSSLTGEGVGALWAEVLRRLDAASRPADTDEGVLDAGRRASLAACASALQRAEDCVAAGGGAELAAMELREALHHAGQVAGAVSADDVLGRIFAKFCVGK